MRVYATVDDLEDEVEGIPNPDQLLQLASAVVELMVAGSVYTVDSQTGLPYYPEDAAKLRRATVLQAIYMADDPYGKQFGYTKMSTSTVSVEGLRSLFAPRAVEWFKAVGLPGSGFMVRS